MQIIFLFLINIIFGQNLVVNDAGNESDKYIMAYTSTVPFRFDVKTVKDFINEIDKKITDILLSNDFEKNIEIFKQEGNYLNFKYLSAYFHSLLKTIKDDKQKEAICNILIKYNNDSQIGFTCKGDLAYSKSKLKFYEYGYYYFSGFLKSENLTDLLKINITYFVYMCFLIFSLVILIRNFRLFVYDIYSLINLKLSHYESLFISLSVVFIGFAFTVDMLYLILLYIGLFFVYFEKKFIPLFLFLILSPLLTYFLIGNYNENNIKYNDLGKTAIESVYYDYVLNQMDISKLQNEQKNYAYLAIAKHYKSINNLENSKKHYENLLKTEQKAYVYNNSANVLFFLKNEKKAIEYYLEAIKLNSKEPVYYYNLSKVFYRTGNKKDGDKFRNIAIDMNKKLIKKYDENSTFHFNKFLIDDFPSIDEFKANLTKEKQNEIAFLKFNMTKYIIFAIISFLIYLIGYFTLNRKLAGRYCSKCGKNFNELTTPVKFGSLCFECHNILNSRGNLEHSQLHKKEIKIRIYTKFTLVKDICVNLILPGGYLFYRKLSWFGILFMTYHAFFMSVLFYSKEWKEVIINNGSFYTYIVLLSIFEIYIYIYSFIKIRKIN